MCVGPPAIAGYASQPWQWHIVWTLYSALDYVFFFLLYLYNNKYLFSEVTTQAKSVHLLSVLRFYISGLVTLWHYLAKIKALFPLTYSLLPKWCEKLKISHDSVHFRTSFSSYLNEFFSVFVFSLSSDSQLLTSVDFDLFCHGPLSFRYTPAFGLSLPPLLAMYACIYVCMCRKK